MDNNDLTLLVEDDLIDVQIFRRGMRDAHLTNPLQVVRNGEEALMWLREPEYPRPKLILLDLNMPRMSGREFLQALRADSNLKNLTVVVLTTSEESRDRAISASLCVADYIVKPIDYAQFISVIKTLPQYWSTGENVENPQINPHVSKPNFKI